MLNNIPTLVGGGALNILGIAINKKNVLKKLNNNIG